MRFSTSFSSHLEDIQVSRFLTTGPSPFSGSMSITLGLPDAEIDRLLLEAEARLSGNGSSDAVAVVPAAKASAIVAAPVAPAAGEQTAVSEKKKSEKLTVRVPQLGQKQKVRALQSTPLNPRVP